MFYNCMLTPFLRQKAILLAAISIFSTATTFAQSVAGDVLVASGGVFEFGAPYSDYVTVSLRSSGFQVLNTVYTQSVQQAIAYPQANSSFSLVALAAQDSLVLYSAGGNLQRVATVGIPDAFASYHTLYKKDNDTTLFAGKWYGSSPDFLYYYNANTLQLQGAITGITQDVTGMAAIGDTLYITQSLPTWNFYADSLTYLAKVYLPTRTFAGNSFYGATGLLGAKDVFAANGKLYMACTGSNNIAIYNPAANSMQYISAAGTLGKSYYLQNGVLGVLRDYAVQRFDIASQQWSSLACYTDAPDNVSCATAPDNLFAAQGVSIPAFIGVTDYTSYGKLYEINGNCQRTVHQVGVSPEAAVAFYYTTTATAQIAPNFEWQIAPNPTADYVQITVPTTEQAAIKKMQLTDVFGQTVRTIEGFAAYISVADLPTGTYFLQLHTATGIFMKKVVRL